MFVDEYRTIEGKAQANIEDRGWSFDAIALPVSSVKQAKEEKKGLTGKNGCFAARIGWAENSETVTGGDGESEDMAQPILNVIDNAGLTNVLIVVTKSAIPGKKTTAAAERAYYDAALNALQRAKKVVRIQYRTVNVLPGDENIDFVGNFIQDLRAKVTHVTRGKDTVMTVKVRAGQIDSFKANLLARYPKIQILTDTDPVS